MKLVDGLAVMSNSHHDFILHEKGHGRAPGLLKTVVQGPSIRTDRHAQLLHEDGHCLGFQIPQIRALA